MILGIDSGGSAVKIAILDKGEVLHCAYMANKQHNAEKAIMDKLRLWGVQPAGIALTGVSAAIFDEKKLGLNVPVQRVLEVDSIAAGAVFLTGHDENLTVSIGTGTAFVLRRNGENRHIGGSAFGGGTLSALCRGVMDMTPTFKDMCALCAKGDLSRVDLLMGEMPSCPPSLDPELTAANLVKTDENTSPEDWALGLLNMVMMTVGSMAYLTASALGIEDIVFIGGPTAVEQTQDILAGFTKAYGKNFTAPVYSECATAIGAACIFQEV